MTANPADGANPADDNEVALTQALLLSRLENLAGVALAAEIPPEQVRGAVNRALTAHRRRQERPAPPHLRLVRD